MIRLSKNGDAGYIKIKGRMINEFFDVTHEEAVFKMEPGDRLVLYTDGITEAVSPDGSMLGDDDRHFLNWVRGLSEECATADELCGRIFSGVTSFTGGENVDDDVTILAAEFF
jgi:serine phosphatase RsbU (regulator of sigma subunit)